MRTLAVRLLGHELRIMKALDAWYLSRRLAVSQCLVHWHAIISSAGTFLELCDLFFHLFLAAIGIEATSRSQDCIWLQSQVGMIPVDGGRIRRDVQSGSSEMQVGVLTRKRRAI